MYQKHLIKLIKRTFILSQLTLICIAPLIAQKVDCRVITPDFGPPTPTLCQRYEDEFSHSPIAQTHVWGSNTPYPTAIHVINALGSSSVSGLILITGNFFVNADLTLLNSKVRISPNVQIKVASNFEFTLDNAKLFCCTDMWDGIDLEDGCYITT